MHEDQLKQAMADEGMIQEGHFVLSSGCHAQYYVNCAIPLIRCSPFYNTLVEEIASRIRPGIAQETGRCIIVGTGKGSFYVQDVARLLALKHNGKGDITFRFVFAQKQGSDLFFPYEQGTIIQNAEIVFIDDVYVTGKTLRTLHTAVSQAHSQIVQYIAIANRSPEHWRGPHILNTKVEIY